MLKSRSGFLGPSLHCQLLHQALQLCLLLLVKAAICCWALYTLVAAGASSSCHSRGLSLPNCRAQLLRLRLTPLAAIHRGATAAVVVGLSAQRPLSFLLAAATTWHKCGIAGRTAGAFLKCSGCCHDDGRQAVTVSPAKLPQPVTCLCSRSHSDAALHTSRPSTSPGGSLSSRAILSGSPCICIRAAP